MADTPLLDPCAPDFRRDPHPHYQRLRRKSPVYRHPAGGWLLSRHADCVAALQDTRLRNVEHIRCYPDGAAAPGTSAGESDSDYARMRKAVARAIAPAAVRRFQPRVARIVDDLLSSAVQSGDVDLVDAFCHPLAATVFCEIFGVPVSDRPLFREWVDDIVQGADIVVDDSPEVTERRDSALARFGDYFRGLIAERRRRPTDDLLGALVAIEQDGAVLTEDELISSCSILLITGHESTVHFVANSTHALLRHPTELRRFRAVPGIHQTAIEELMRYTSPANLVVRAARTDLEIDGHSIQEGELITILLGAANRDPEVFNEPERLDLTRDPNPHLAFGHGAHFCLGATLARMEGEIALTALTRRAPRLAARGEPVFKPTFGLRGIAELPVSLR